MKFHHFWLHLEKSTTAHTLCCDRKARAACAQSFALWKQATIEITRRDHSIIACSRHVHIGVILRAHSVRGEPPCGIYVVSLIA